MSGEIQRQYKEICENTYQSVLMGAAFMKYLMLNNEEYARKTGRDLTAMANSSYFYGSSGTRKSIENGEEWMTKEHIANADEIAALSRKSWFIESSGSFGVMVAKSSAIFGIDEHAYFGILVEQCASAETKRTGKSFRNNEEKAKWFIDEINKNQDNFSKFPGGPAGIKPVAFQDMTSGETNGDPKLVEFIRTEGHAELSRREFLTREFWVKGITTVSIQDSQTPKPLKLNYELTNRLERPPMEADASYVKIRVYEPSEYQKVEDALISTVIGYGDTTAETLPVLLIEERKALENEVNGIASAAYSLVKDEMSEVDRKRFYFNSMSVGIGDDGNLFLVVDKNFSVEEYKTMLQSGSGEGYFPAVLDRKHLEEFKKHWERQGVKVYTQEEYRKKQTGLLLFSGVRDGRTWKCSGSLDQSKLADIVQSSREQYRSDALPSKSLGYLAISASVLEKKERRHVEIVGGRGRESLFWEETVKNGMPLCGGDIETVTTLSLFPENVRSLKKHEVRFCSIGGDEESASIVEGTSADGKITIADPKRGTRGKGSSFDLAMKDLLQNEVDQGERGPGILYYESGGAVKYLETPKSTFEKYFEVADTALYWIMNAAFAVSIIASFGTATPEAVATEGAVAALRTWVKKKVRSFVLKMVTEEAAKKVALYSNRVMVGAWAGYIAREYYDASKKEDAKGVSAYEGTGISSAGLAFIALPGALQHTRMFLTIVLDKQGHNYFERKDLERGSSAPALDVTHSYEVEKLPSPREYLKKMGISEEIYRELLKDVELEAVARYDFGRANDQDRCALSENTGVKVSEFLKNNKVSAGFKKELLEAVRDYPEITVAEYIALRRKERAVLTRAATITNLKESGLFSEIAGRFGMSETEFTWFYLTKDSIYFDCTPEHAQNALAGFTTNSPTGYGLLAKAYLGSIYETGAKEAYGMLLDQMMVEHDGAIVSASSLLAELRKKAEQGSEEDRGLLAEFERELNMTIAERVSQLIAREREGTLFRDLGDGSQDKFIWAYLKEGHWEFKISKNGTLVLGEGESSNVPKVDAIPNRMEGLWRGQGFDSSGVSYYCWRCIKTTEADDIVRRGELTEEEVVELRNTWRVGGKGILLTDVSEIDSLIAYRLRELARLKKKGKLDALNERVGGENGESYCRNAYMTSGGPADPLGKVLEDLPKDPKATLLAMVDDANKRLASLGAGTMDGEALWDDYVSGRFTWDWMQSRLSKD